MTKPADLVRWAVDGVDADASNISVPSSGAKDVGYAFEEIPTSGNFNYFLNRNHRWFQYLSAGAFEGASSFDDALAIAGDLSVNAATILTGDLTLGPIVVVPDFVFTAVNATDTMTSVAHGRATGDGPFQAVNSGGALPAGLLPATNYWIISLTADTFKLASSLALAMLGTPVGISTDGTGTQSLVDTVSTHAAASCAISANLSVANAATIAGNLTVSGSYGTISATTVTAGTVNATSSLKHGTMSAIVSSFGYRPKTGATTLDLDANGNWTSWGAAPNDVIRANLPLRGGDRLISITWIVYKAGSAAPITMELISEPDDPLIGTLTVIDTFSDTSSSSFVTSNTTRTLNLTLSDIGYGLRVTSTTAGHVFIRGQISFNRP